MEALLVIPLIVCLVAIIKPLPQLWLPSRKRAALGALGFFVVIGVVANAKEDAETPASAAPATYPPQAATATPRQQPLPPPQPTRQAPPVQQATVNISAGQLHRAYKANELQADQTYKDKILSVTGVIEKVGKDPVHGNPVVHLKAGIEFIEFLQCHFEDDDLPTLSTLRAGQTARVEGRCMGFDSIWSSVILKNCRVNGKSQ